MTTRRPRLGIAVQPTVLRDALSRVLITAGVDDVINLTSIDAATGEHYDVVVVSDPMVDVDADVVITVPAEPGDAGWVEVGGVRVDMDGTGMDVASLAGLLRALDRYCPAEHEREPHA
jgi:hypothetical protein